MKTTPHYLAKYTLNPLTLAVLLTLSGSAVAADAFVPIGFMPNDTYSSAGFVSADGSVAAGSGSNYAFIWSNGTMTNLGTLGGSSSSANAISADGSAVAGYATTTNGINHAFRWTSGTGMVDLGTLGGTNSYANAISADGSTAIGSAQTAGNLQYLAFRWTQATGMQSIAAWLSNAGVTLPTGWTLNNANAVNQNGNVIVGDGTDSNGNTQAWLARVVPGSSGLLTNLAAFNASLIQTGGLTAQNGIALPNLTLFGAHHRTLMDDGLVHTANGSCAWATTDAAHYNNTNTDAQIIEAGGCKDIGATRIGLGVGQSWSRQTWDMGGGAKFNGQYLVAEADRNFSAFGGKSMEGSLLAYYGQFKTELHRNYMNGAAVDSSSGTPDATSIALRARLDWKDAAQWGRYSFSPYANYTWSQSDIAAYTETGGGFPASYQANTSRTNDIRIGTVAKTALTASTDMRIGVEAAHRMESNVTGVNGQVTGLYSFNLAGTSVKQNWVRSTIDFDHRLTKTMALTAGANAATSGGNATWGLTAGLRAVF